jgi:hypothetical protein
MSEIKRITPEEVVQAFEDTGLKPHQGTYFGERDDAYIIPEGDNCACAMGAIYYKEFGVKSNEAHDYFVNKFTRNYQLGFACGFDNSDKLFEGQELFDIGYEDGENARLTLVAKGMM